VRPACGSATVFGVKILFATAPGYGLMLPLVPLAWAARVAGHEILVATTSEMVEAGARSGLPVVDVVPDRDVWAELVHSTASRLRGEDGPVRDDLPEEYARAVRAGNPFGLFTLTMTEGTIESGRRFGADLVVTTSDHETGRLAGLALGVPVLEVGNRVSWSLRDADFRARSRFHDEELIESVRSRLSIPARAPDVVARIDPRAPSMGGMTVDEPDAHDGVPWWSMRFVPFNGGAAVPEWALRRPERPRVAVTLGTVVPAMSGISGLRVVIDALAGMDVDVVLAAGEADLSSLSDLPANVLSVGFQPLSAFLSTCSLIVHHGGSGTTATPLHYGVPQLVLPAFADNPLSAERVVRRGVGLSHDPSTVDAATVRASARRLLDEPAFAEAAAEVRDEMATQPSPATIIDRVTDKLR
jgi:UDP:flavonoid glycosyltransferase YjiC (YdhE family)